MIRTMNYKMINIVTESSLQKDSGNIKGVANSLHKARNGLTITKEALKASVGTKVPLLLNHKWDSNPVGEVNIESLDDDGLHYTGSIFQSAPDRDLLIEGIQNGVQSVSVGLNVLKHDGPMITDAELLELSLTPVPADANATVEAFKLNNNDNKQTENNNNNNQEQPQKQQATTTLTDVVNAINNLTSAVKSLKTTDNNSNSQSPDNNSDQLKEALSKTLSVYGNTFSYHDYREIKNLLNKSEGEN